MALPPVTPAATTPDQDAIIVINGSEYIFELILFNGDIAIRIPNRLIHNLTIIDSMYSVFHYGHLILKNEFNTLENFSTIESSFHGESIRDSSLLFKSNVAGDIIAVKIKPKMPPYNADSLSNQDWSLSFMFSIYDEDEIHDNTSTDKLKILKFRDIREDILDNTLLPWSSADVLAKQNQSNFNLSQLSDSARQVKTGSAIQDIITSTLPDFSNKFDENWDPGNTGVFYSSPCGASRFDALEFCLDQHISVPDSDNCLLKAERSGIWTLLPLTVYFQKALRKTERLPGDFTVDIFHLHNQSHQEQVDLKIPPKSKNAYDVRIPVEEFAGLFNYGYSNISAQDSCNELVTTPVHSYMVGQKLFSVDVTDHDIDAVQSKFQDLYIKHMHGEPPMNTIPVNPAKQQQLLFNNVYSLYGPKTQRIKDGRGRVFSKALAFNYGITFNLEGFTIRRSARFISVVNSGQFPETAFQNIIQGEWLVTQVAHVFSGNTYRNDITAVKPYTYKLLT